MSLRVAATVAVVAASVAVAIWLLRADDAAAPAINPAAGAPRVGTDPGIRPPAAGRPVGAIPASPPVPVAVRPFSADDEAHRIELTCVGEGGQPVAGALIAAVDAAASAAPPIVLATSAANGVATFGAGPATVTCCHPDFLPAVVALPTAPTLRATRQTVVLRAGGTVTGTVVDQDGAALAGVTVRVEVGAPMALPPSAAAAEIAGVDVRNCDAIFRTLRRATATGADGAFTLHGVPPGNHLLSAEKAGYVGVGAHECTPVKTDGEAIRVRLARVFALGIRATGADDLGAAAARSLVDVSPRVPASVERVTALQSHARDRTMAALERRIGAGAVFQLWSAGENSQLGTATIAIKATARVEGCAPAEVDTRLVPAELFAATDCLTVDLARVVPTLAEVRVTAPLPMQLRRTPPTGLASAAQPVVDADGVQVFRVEAGSYVASAGAANFIGDARAWDTAVEAKVGAVTTVTVSGPRMPARLRVSVTDGAGHATDQYTLAVGSSASAGSPAFPGAGGGGEAVFWVRPGPLVVRLFDLASRVVQRVEITVTESDADIPLALTYGPK